MVQLYYKLVILEFYGIIHVSRHSPPRIISPHRENVATYLIKERDDEVFN